MILIAPTDLCVQILFHDLKKAELSLSEGRQSSTRVFRKDVALAYRPLYRCKVLSQMLVIQKTMGRVLAV